MNFIAHSCDKLSKDPKTHYPPQGPSRARHRHSPASQAAIAVALRILSELGVQLHPQKTRVVHVRQGFEFLGYKIKRGKQLRLPPDKIRSGARSRALYAYPREKSIQRFMDQVRQLTKRHVPPKTKELMEEFEPDIAGMGSSLQASPRPKALQPTRPLGCAPDLVASFSRLAELRLEVVAGDYSVQRVRACELGAIDPILGVSVERAFVK